MYEPKSKILTTTREHYMADVATVIQQRDDDQETTLSIRRVIPSGVGEHVQMEITIKKFNEKRTTHASCSFLMAPEVATAMVQALLTVK